MCKKKRREEALPMICDERLPREISIINIELYCFPDWSGKLFYWCPHSDVQTEIIQCFRKIKQEVNQNGKG